MRPFTPLWHRRRAAALVRVRGHKVVWTGPKPDLPLLPSEIAQARVDAADEGMRQAEAAQEELWQRLKGWEDQVSDHRSGISDDDRFTAYEAAKEVRVKILVAANGIFEARREQEAAVAERAACER